MKKQARFESTAVPVVGENQFQCASCFDVFEKVWTDEEAEAERLKTLPDLDLEECVQLCEGCFRRATGLPTLN